MDEAFARRRLKDRIMFHSRGIVVKQRAGGNPVTNIQSKFGGIGIVGRQYYIQYDENEPLGMQVRVQAFPEDDFYAQYAIKTTRCEDNPYNLITEEGVKLISLERDIVHDTVPLQGTPVSFSAKMAMHCYKTYPMVVTTKCHHFDTDEGCIFCTTNVANEQIKDPTDEENLQALKVALDYNSVRSIVITSGTYPNADGVAKRMLELMKKIRKITNLSIRFELEPLDDLSIMPELAKYANGAIGIYLESFDEEIRKKVCPSKYRLQPREKYIENWKEAVKWFGRGNVSTHVLLGYGGNYEEIIKGVEMAAEMGVKTVMMLVGLGSKNLGENFVPSYFGKEDDLVDLYLEVAKVQAMHGVEHKFGDAGCHGCAGCSPMMEAAQYARHVLRKEGKL